MDIRDECGQRIDINSVEKAEQDLANKYIDKNDVVFELGARYGSVSCTINLKLKCKTNQLVVEPDQKVWEALERNKVANGCEFHIIKGFISNKKLNLTGEGYSSSFVEDDNTNIPSYSLDDIKRQYNLKFNVLIADCEGFLETFFDENPTFYDNLRLIIFEEDCPSKCNYSKIRGALKMKGFKEIYNYHQNVWLKTNALTL